MSRTRRRRYLVAYDVSDDKRRDKLFKRMQGHGDWAQFSVFFCELTSQELVRLRMDVRATIHQHEDQVLIVDLGRALRPVEHSLEVMGRGYEPTMRSHIV